MPYSKIKLLNTCAAVAILIYGFFAPVIAQASGQASTEFKLTEITEGVFVHYGKHAEFDSPGHDDIANIGFIVGEKCVAVIDSGGSVKIGQLLLTAVLRNTSTPICYVINTHIHFDHMLGNIVFQNESVKFIGHTNLADEVISNRAFFLEQFRDDLGSNPSDDSIVGPDLLVKDSMKIDLGNRKLLLKAYGSAHSHTDLSVYDSKSKTLWLSDLFFTQRIPALNGSLKGWLKTIEELKQSPAEQLVPGHGDVIANSNSAFIDIERYLRTLLSQTRKKIAEGLFMEDIVDSVGNDEKHSWLLHEQHHRRNVTKAFSELEWE